MAPTTTGEEMPKKEIQHPLPKGTKVKYLSPRCPCSGSRWKLVESVIVGSTKNGNTVVYTLRAEKRGIPTAGIVEVIG